tara:strand:- start:67 stop:330 length:264 start_codon:yes stop_codon:yes gene_type:complete
MAIGLGGCGSGEKAALGGARDSGWIDRNRTFLAGESVDPVSANTEGAQIELQLPDLAKSPPPQPVQSPFSGASISPATAISIVMMPA